LPVMVLVIAPFALRERSRTTRVWRDYRRQVAGAAVLSPLAYILVLIALSFTAVAAVAPAREVSVLAGVLLGRTMLGEAGLAWRLAAAGAIAAGIIRALPRPRARRRAVPPRSVPPPCRRGRPTRTTPRMARAAGRRPAPA